jgi:hypothetical protein
VLLHGEYVICVKTTEGRNPDGKMISIKEGNVGRVVMINWELLTASQTSVSMEGVKGVVVAPASCFLKYPARDVSPKRKVQLHFVVLTFIKFVTKNQIYRRQKRRQPRKGRTKMKTTRHLRNARTRPTCVNAQGQRPLNRALKQKPPPSSASSNLGPG